MLRTIEELNGCAIRATDGLIGQVKDCLFDDHRWAIRYLVVDTGTWLASRSVLIIPGSVTGAQWADKVLSVSITREQVRNSPDIDTERPVSRQHEISVHGHYAHPYYWTGPDPHVHGLHPAAMPPDASYAGSVVEPYSAQEAQARAQVEVARHEKFDPSLRSGNAVKKYHIAAIDGGIGQVHGLLLEEETWAIRYLIVNTSLWWFGHRVLIAPQWIQDVQWLDSAVSVNLTRQAVRHAPSYDASKPLSRDLEVALYHHHGREGYWNG